MGMAAHLHVSQYFNFVNVVFMAVQHNGSSPDLLLTDVVMPHLSGPELARQLLALRPTLRVLFMSGYPGEELEQQGSVISPDHILFKPFTHEELARRVRQVLTPP